MGEFDRSPDPTGMEPVETPSAEIPKRGEWRSPEGTAPSEAFGALANEIRVTVLVELLAAERAEETPVAFSELQAAAGVEESAKFAYHLRQLREPFLSVSEAGYVLTPAGRRVARAIVSGAFTENTQTQAS